MTDNIIPLRGITLTPHFTTEPETSVSDITPEQGQMALSIANAADFLLQNRDNIQYFVLGVALKPPAGQEATLDVSFHLHTSPITTADFALTSRLIDKALVENMGGIL